MKTTNKVLLAGSTAIGLALAATPAFAQITIGGDVVEVVGGTDSDDPNNGGTLDLNGAAIATDGGNITTGTGDISTDNIFSDGINNSSGINNTDGLTTDTLNVTGASTTSGITNTGAIGTTSLTSTTSSTGATTATTLTSSGNTALGTTDGSVNSLGGGANSVNNLNGTTNVNGTLAFAPGSDLDMNGNAINNVGTLNVTDVNAVNGTFTGTLQVDGLSSLNGGVDTNGADINTAGGNINAGAGNVIAAGGSFTTVVNTPTITNGGLGGAQVTIFDNVNVAGTLGTAGAGALVVADDLQVNGQVTGGNTAGDVNQIGGANATSSTIAAGTSYVAVTANQVEIHGGTTSTSVFVNDAGVQVVDSTNGQTFAVSSTGNATLLGGLTAGGNVVVGNGIAGGGGQNAIATGVTIDATTQRVTGVANGVISATSNDAVTGQQLFATNQQVAGLNAGLSAVNGRVDTLENRVGLLDERADKAYQGVAMGFAMNAAPLILANGEGGIAGGVGYFQGEWGGAVKAQYVTDAGVGVGVNVGFSQDAVGGGVGASIKF